ncbi:G-protein coupled receptor Mth, partial [Drosophila grimshawi]|uniref:G-protein coupled receptor Mth n=1 Tax=Drosophila grimshawi TaxID=7222 RepID=UPI001C9340BD
LAFQLGTNLTQLPRKDNAQVPQYNQISDIPECDYFDTVDLRESTRYPNGSFQYENLIIPAEQTGEYDYEILVDGEKESVKKHLRGCACKLGACVRFCCHKNLFLVQDQRTCSGDISRAVDFDPYVSITQSDGKQVIKHILDDFIVQRHLPVPCAAHHHMDAENDKNHNWTLFEDGTLQRHSDKINMSKQEYCLQPHPIKTGENETIITLVPHMCAVTVPSQWLQHILRVLSIIFLILTIIVYLSLSKLRNLHGYCFICYMICIALAFALLQVDSWGDDWTLAGCMVNGYVGYFAVMAGFLWLTVISYDLWTCFRSNNYNIQRYTPKYRFLIYSIYAWGVAALLTITVIVLDQVLDVDDEDQTLWRPGVAFYSCWVNTMDWSAMLYFYGPMALQIIFNLIMFTLTARGILRVKRELQSVATKSEKSQKFYQKKYTLFVRLFVIMGVAWTFEILSYLSKILEYSALEIIFEIFDYINCAQGIIIFGMFVVKRRVLKLILSRFHQEDRRIRHTEMSSFRTYKFSRSQVHRNRNFPSLKETYKVLPF